MARNSKTFFRNFYFSKNFFPGFRFPNDEGIVIHGTEAGSMKKGSKTRSLFSDERIKKLVKTLEKNLFWVRKQHFLATNLPLLNTFCYKETSTFLGKHFYIIGPIRLLVCSTYACCSIGRVRISS
jgi:hypothetical protein